MQNTVYETDEKDVKDERKDLKDEKEDVKDEKEKKLHTTPNSTLVQFGAAPQDGARIGRQLQTPATLAYIYMLYYTEIDL